MNKIDFDFSIRAKLTKDSVPFYGIGVQKLLILTNEHQSLRAASMQMNMSYSKAFRIVKEAENAIGYKLLDSAVGGSSGGYSKLTKEAEILLKKYDKFTSDINEFAKHAFQEIF